MAQIVPQSDSLKVKEGWKILPNSKSDSTGIRKRPMIPRNYKDSIAASRSVMPSSSSPLPTGVKYADDALDEPLDYSARDSQRFEAKNQVVHLYGAAEVKYQDLILKADYIVFNLKDNIAIAEGMPDSTGRIAGKPDFNDGTQEFKANKLKYNFKTQKGIIYDAKSKQNDLYVLGSKTKYIGEKEQKEKKNDVVYTSGSVLTTCNHPEPHFGIRANKIKIVPNDIAVVGPSNIEIAGIGTPLYLPFGFFPISDKKHSGLVRGEWQFSDQLGFGLTRWGWYFPMGETRDLTVRADLYLRGSFHVYADMNYKKRYKYNGSLTLDFGNNRVDEIGGYGIVNNQSMGIRWSHNQDARAHPTRKFSGNVNIQTNLNQARNNNDANSRLQNSLSSNITYSQSFVDKPYSLTASFNHSQNTRTRAVTVNFPNVRFNVRTLYPFRKPKGKGGKEKWYEQISLKYDAEMKNRFVTTDTTLFSKQTLEDAQFGIRQKISSGTSFKIFKYFSLNPSVNATEVWYGQYLEKEFDPTLDIDTMLIYTDPLDSTLTKLEFDTTGYGSVNDLVRFGFKPLHLFNSSISINTQVFGTALFKKGWLRGLRHQMTPSVSLNYTPNYTADFFNYFRNVRTDTRDEFDRQDQYSVFDNGVFDRPSSNGKVMGLTYSIGNRFEAKYYSKKDSTEKKFIFFNSINVNGGYNFAKDTLKFSDVNITGNTTIIKSVSNFRFRARLSPYALNDAGTGPVNKYWWDENKKPLRFVDLNFSLSTGMTVRKLRDLISGKNEKRSAGGAKKDKTSKGRPNASGRSDRSAAPESFLDWFDNFRISHEFRANVRRVDGRDTFIVTTNSIRTGGTIRLTKNWNLNIGNLSYDFKSKEFVYPALGFSRDLHCWDLSVQWYPRNNIYSFSLKVKPGSLGFLQVPWGRNRFDAGSQLNRF